MQVIVTINGKATQVNARTYAFPKKGTQPDNYTLTVDGKTLNGLQDGVGDVATTGREGGKYPCYTYFMYEGVSYWLPKELGLLPSGSTIDIVTEAAKTTPAATPAPVEATPAPVETPPAAEAPKKGRRKPKVEVPA